MNEGKSNAREVEAAEISLSTNSNDSRGPDLSRRRLIRGAAGIAPLVITLRSGALAAGSCTGAKAVATTGTNNDGKLATITGIPSAGDVCVNGYTATQSCANTTDTSKPLKIDSSADSPLARQQGTLRQDGSDYYCDAITSQNANIALMTSGTTSFI